MAIATMPYNITVTEFSSMDEYTVFQGRYSEYYSNIWLWHEKLGNVSSPIAWSGFCDVCQKLSCFRVNTSPETDSAFQFRAQWVNLICENCRLGTRERAVAYALSALGVSNSAIYHVGYHSVFSNYLAEIYRDVSRSQFQNGIRSGFIDSKGVRYEDLTNLSYENERFNILVCMEVLEHIADYKKAISEMARVLRPGGRAILTFPWLGGKFYEHRERAEMRPDGSINHILPPEYHDDPASEEGILSFRAFGWKILDELRSGGFKGANATFLFGPLHGYMTSMLPIIIASK